MAQRDLVPRQIAEMVGVNVTKVLGWIRSGELIAYSVSNSARPRWRITQEAFEAFKDSRSNKARNPATRRRQQQLTKEYV